jgi:hypothetical protein
MTARPSRMHMISLPIEAGARPTGEQPSLRLGEHGASASARPVRERAPMPRRLALLGALAALLAPLAACGRKAAPEPPEGAPKDAFPKRYPPPGT